MPKIAENPSLTYPAVSELLNSKGGNVLYVSADMFAVAKEIADHIQHLRQNAGIDIFKEKEAFITVVLVEKYTWGLKDNYSLGDNSF